MVEVSATSILNRKSEKKELCEKKELRKKEYEKKDKKEYDKKVRES